MSKTELIVEEFRQRIRKAEEKYQLVPEQKKLRSNSLNPKKMSEYTKPFRLSYE